MIRPVQKVSSIDDNLKFNWVSDFHQIIKAKFLSQTKNNEVGIKTTSPRVFKEN